MREVEYALQRKISERLEEFYKNRPHKALMIIGARQAGKSYIISEYAKPHYIAVCFIAERTDTDGQQI